MVTPSRSKSKSRRMPSGIFSSALFKRSKRSRNSRSGPGCAAKGAMIAAVPITLITKVLRNGFIFCSFIRHYRLAGPAFYGAASGCFLLPPHIFFCILSTLGGGGAGLGGPGFALFHLRPKYLYFEQNPLVFDLLTQILQLLCRDSRRAVRNFQQHPFQIFEQRCGREVPGARRGLPDRNAAR